jgi:hypothetical protein
VSGALRAPFVPVRLPVDCISPAPVLFRLHPSFLPYTLLLLLMLSAPFDHPHLLFLTSISKPHIFLNSPSQCYVLRLTQEMSQLLYVEVVLIIDSELSGARVAMARNYLLVRCDEVL